MDIRTAIQNRTADKPYITRQSWVDEMEGALFRHNVPKILPTSSVDCCVITSLSSTPCRGWQPSKADLVALDWIVTD